VQGKHQYKIIKKELHTNIPLVLSGAQQMHLTSSVHLSRTDSAVSVIFLGYFLSEERPDSQMR